MRGHVPPHPGSYAERDLNVVGPMARSARDLRMLLSIIEAGPLAPKAPPADLHQIRIGLWLDDPSCPLDPAVRAVLEAFAGELRAVRLRQQRRHRAQRELRWRRRRDVEPDLGQQLGLLGERLGLALLLDGDQLDGVAVADALLAVGDLPTVADDLDDVVVVDGDAVALQDLSGPGLGLDGHLDRWLGGDLHADGHLAVGHTRYSTTGSSTWRNAQPVWREVGGRQLALGHNGNLTNTAQLAEDAGMLPGLVTSDSDLLVELIGHELERMGEELSHDEARTQDVGLEFALHVPFQGDPSIEQLLGGTATLHLKNSSARMTLTSDTAWTLDKQGTVNTANQTVTWSITATRASVSGSSAPRNRDRARRAPLATPRFFPRSRVRNTTMRSASPSL